MNTLTWSGRRILIYFCFFCATIPSGNVDDCEEILFCNLVTCGSFFFLLLLWFAYYEIVLSILAFILLARSKKLNQTVALLPMTSTARNTSAFLYELVLTRHSSKVIPFLNGMWRQSVNKVLFSILRILKKIIKAFTAFACVEILHAKKTDDWEPGTVQ